MEISKLTIPIAAIVLDIKHLEHLISQFVHVPLLVLPGAFAFSLEGGEDGLGICRRFRQLAGREGEHSTSTTAHKSSLGGEGKTENDDDHQRQLSMTTHDVGVMIRAHHCRSRVDEGVCDVVASSCYESRDIL